MTNRSPMLTAMIAMAAMGGSSNALFKPKRPIRMIRRYGWAGDGVMPEHETRQARRRRERAERKSKS